MVTALGLLASACAGHNPRAALGWSLGGEAHVFVIGDRFARDLFHQLTGADQLRDSLRRRDLIAVAVTSAQTATVLSSNGAAAARLTLARFHAADRCRTADVVTELVLAFPPPPPPPAGGSAGHTTPPSHVTVVALLDASSETGDPETSGPALDYPLSRELVTRVADRAELTTRGTPLGRLHRPILDEDQAADAGEVFSVGSQYAVGFRVTFTGTTPDTTLITGVATTDTSLRALRWVVPPRRLPLHGGMIASAGTRRSNQAMRYSLRGVVAGPRGTRLLLLDEITDASARAARATAVDAATGRVVAAQPLALRCP